MTNAENKAPLREGIADRPEEISTDPMRMAQLRIGQAKSLQELSTDYAFFTPGLLYVYMPESKRADPLQDFVHVYKNSEAKPFTMTFDRPVFQGLAAQGSKFWNHALCAIAKPYFLTFTDWARSLTFYDQRNKLFVRIRPMLITILDPLFLANKLVDNRVPSIDVGVLALDTNMGNVYIDDAQCKTGGLAKVVTDKEVFRDTKVFADVLFAGDTNPLARVEEDQMDPNLGLTPAEAWLIREYGDRAPAKVQGQIDFSQLSPAEQQEIQRLMQEFNNQELKGKR
jgi:hypothetical protein